MILSGRNRSATSRAKRRITRMGTSAPRYQRGDSVLHIELRKWADILVIAPLDANTLAKLAVGLCDNCLTCVWRAWDPARAVGLAPAMNTLMWEHPFTRRHLRSLAADAGAGHIPGHLDNGPLIAQINDRSKTLRVVPPVENAEWLAAKLEALTRP